LKLNSWVRGEKFKTFTSGKGDAKIRRMVGSSCPRSRKWEGNPPKVKRGIP